MPYSVIPSIISLVFCAGFALFVGLKGARCLGNLGFAVGMGAIAVQELAALMLGFSLEGSPSLHWARLGLFGQALAGGGWTLFSMTFAKEKGALTANKWGSLLGVYGLAAASFLFWPLFKAPDLPGGTLLVHRSGYFFSLFYLAVLVFVLMNLEQTFRSATRLSRYKTKYMLLGIGALLAIEVYRSVQVLLFSAVDLQSLPVYAAARVISYALIFFAVTRHRLLNVELFISRYIVYKSATLLGIGSYLGLVGLMVMGVQRFGDETYVRLIPIAVFVALLGLVILLLSEELRRKMQTFINVHFFRNKHDYRLKWQEFTHAVGSRLTLTDLLTSLVQWLSETIGTNHVAIWLLDNNRNRYYLASRRGFAEAPTAWLGEGSLLEAIRECANSLVLKKGHRLFRDIQKDAPDFLRIHPETAWIPLRSGQEIAGLLVLGSKMTQEPYDYHDLELLETIADQAAGQIDRVRLIEELAVMRELKAIHTLSSFFLHDLKNYTSTLSLLAQNVENHGHNPDFQKDAFQTIRGTVDKMNQLIRHITVVAKGLVLSKSEIDLNHLVETTLAGLNGALGMKGRVYSIFGDLPSFSGDPEQLANVLRNLIINAYNAGRGGKEGGDVHIETWTKNNHVYFSVSDQGCGMSESFIATKLFKPLRSSRTAGWGIGLFQCQQVVRAHGGRILVKSEEGRGSTFTVELPLEEAKVQTS